MKLVDFYREMSEEELVVDLEVFPSVNAGEEQQTPVTHHIAAIQQTLASCDRSSDDQQQ